MPRVTKVMLVEQVVGLHRANSQLREELNQLREINKVLKKRCFSHR